jgi:hypothetical protein
MPRCFAISFAEFVRIVRLEENPADPGDAFILRQHLRDGGLAMDFCRVEKWNPFVICIT